MFGEKDFGKQKLDFMPTLSCGTCDPQCKAPEGDGIDWGHGIARFPIVLKPGEKKSLKAAGIEVGALVTPTTACSADLEVIALIDLTEYIPPPYGPAIRYAMDLATKGAAKLGVKLECGAGIDLSGTLHLCGSVPGGGLFGVTADSAKICLGGYIGCNVGLPHEKSALPGAKH